MKSYRDIAGDGGSNVLGQVLDQQAKIKNRLGGIDRTIAIGSAKGGVGKSTLTMLIAIALRARGRSVAVLDADFNGTSQAHMAGLKASAPTPGPDGLLLPKTKDGINLLSLGMFLAETEPLQFNSVAHGDSYTWRQTKEFAMLGELLAGVEWGTLDYLLLDLPPGSERTVQFAEYFKDLSGIVLVTLPSALTSGVVARGVSALRESDIPILGYIRNMSGYLCGECGKIQPLFKRREEENFSAPLLGDLPFDPRIAEACDVGLSLETIPPEIRTALNSVVDALERGKKRGIK